MKLTIYTITPVDDSVAAIECKPFLGDQLRSGNGMQNGWCSFFGAEGIRWKCVWCMRISEVNVRLWILFSGSLRVKKKKSWMQICVLGLDGEHRLALFSCSKHTHNSLNLEGGQNGRNWHKSILIRIPHSSLLLISSSRTRRNTHEHWEQAAS